MLPWDESGGYLIWFITESTQTTTTKSNEFDFRRGHGELQNVDRIFMKNIFKHNRFTSDYHLTIYTSKKNKNVNFLCVYDTPYQTRFRFIKLITK